MPLDTRARVGVSSARKRTIVANGLGVRQQVKMMSPDDCMYNITEQPKRGVIHRESIARLHSESRSH